ncbi:MAG TPA: Fur family transcriptional regulator [Clostridiaceae bacterium]
MEGQLYLKQNNIKATKARIYIMGLLLNSDSAITADYIYESSVDKKLFIDLSTVYRTLELLEEKSLVDKFDLGGGMNSFIIKKLGHKHTVECSKCHRELEIDCPMNQIDELIRNKTGFTPIEHELNIKGICEQCKKAGFL